MTFDEVSQTFVLEGVGRRSEAVGRILCDAPLPVSYLTADLGRSISEPGCDQSRRFADLLREVAGRSQISTRDQARLLCEAVVWLVWARDLAAGLKLFDRCRGDALKTHPHVVRRAASYLALSLAETAHDITRSIPYVDAALDGPPETAPLGVYVRCWRVVSGRAAIFREIIDKHRESLAEAWLYLHLESKVTYQTAKGHADWLLRAERPQDKIAAGLLLGSGLENPSFVLGTSAGWQRKLTPADQFIELTPLSPLSSTSRAPDGPPWRKWSESMRTLFRNLDLETVERSCGDAETSNDADIRLAALRWRANLQRCTDSHDSAWTTIESARAVTDSTPGMDPELQSEIHNQRAWIALNTLRPWEALWSARRASCLATLGPNADSLVRALWHEGIIADGLMAYRTGQVKAALRALSQDEPADPTPKERVVELMHDADDWRAYAAGLENRGLLLFAAEAYLHGANFMAGRSNSERKTSWKSLSRDFAFFQAKRIAERIGARRLLLDVLSVHASTLNSLPDEARRSLVNQVSQWRKCIDQVPVDRERGAMIDHLLNSLVVGALERSGRQAADRSCNKDLWFAVQHAKLPVVDEDRDELQY